MIDGLGDGYDVTSLVSCCIRRHPEIAVLRKVVWFDVRSNVKRQFAPGSYAFSWRIRLDDVCNWAYCDPVHFSLMKDNVLVDERKCFISGDAADLPFVTIEGFRPPAVYVAEHGWVEFEVGEFVIEEGEESCALEYAMTSHHGSTNLEFPLMVLLYGWRILGSRVRCVRRLLQKLTRRFYQEQGNSSLNFVMNLVFGIGVQMSTLCEYIILQMDLLIC